MTPDEYCQFTASRSGSSFYYSFRFLPALQRRAMTALYAFCREVDDVVDECNDENIARAKLDWWREEIGRLFNNTPQHKVTQALLPMLEQFNLPEEYFREIIDGMEMDLTRHEYPNFRDLNLYCYRVASVVGLLSAEIFGFSNRLTLRYAQDLGTAFQLTNILRDVREDAARGRYYIPQDEMQQFGITRQDLNRPVTSDKVVALLQFQANRARDFYNKAMAELPDEDRYRQRSGLIMSHIYQTLLDEIEQDGFRVLEHKIKLPPLRKLWLAWSAARNENRLHKKYLRSLRSNSAS
ncbi:MAG: 15-cis-phytoene synthase [Pseudomonadota bacterium]|nr:15-cis-phytoene synthase [Pseudomonadota bacterium]